MTEPDYSTQLNHIEKSIDEIKTSITNLITKYETDHDKLIKLEAAVETEQKFGKSIGMKVASLENTNWRIIIYIIISGVAGGGIGGGIIKGLSHFFK